MKSLCYCQNEEAHYYLSERDQNRQAITIKPMDTLLTTPIVDWFHFGQRYYTKVEAEAVKETRLILYVVGEIQHSQ